MRKLKLEIDELSVESFAVDSHVPVKGGTVHGRVGPLNPDTGGTWDCEGSGGGGYTEGTCIGPTYCCPPTWRETCPTTCGYTCGAWTYCAQQCQYY